MEIPNIVTAVELDTKSRYLDVFLYENSVPVNLEGQAVRIYAKKEDGNTSFEQGTITDAVAGRCQFELTNQMLAKPGELELQISVWSDTAKILSTPIFKLLVTKTLRIDEAVESTNEFGVLVVLFQEIQSALNMMKAMVDNFGEAGEKAEEFGANTFWQMLEALASRADTLGVAKEVLNSTIDTENFSPLNEIIEKLNASSQSSLQTLINQKSKAILGGAQKFTADGVFTVPANVTKIWITACAGGQAGGGHLGFTNPYAGHGGDWLFREPYKVTPGQKLTITVGKGGTAIVEMGKPTIISPLVTLTCPGQRGGAGGIARNSSSSDGSEVNQSNGQDGFAPGGRGVRGSAGGGGSLGRGGDAEGITNKLATGYGGGGGTTNNAVVPGGDGIVIIEW